ncbi:hypothetical protein JCM10207_005516 [Rhodosporidiobolus poonsookiae]
MPTLEQLEDSINELKAQGNTGERLAGLQREFDAIRSEAAAHSLGKDVPLSFRQQRTYGQPRTAHYSPVQRAF